MRSKKADDDRNLLLISSSKVHGGGYLEHCGEAIKNFLVGVKKVYFVPYAGADHNKYEELAKARFAELGFELQSVHSFTDPCASLAGKVCGKYGVENSAIFVGGGNTFRLLQKTQELNLIDTIQDLVSHGMRYVGSSAGTNLACPTIKTTNDMPIVWPQSHRALDLIGFQINPHYVDPDPNSTHMGETREQRIKEFHEENTVPVLGLRERSWLEIHGHIINLCGTSGAKLFRRGRDPVGLVGGFFHIDENIQE